MAFLYRAKRFGYDNIAAGSVAGEEQHVEHSSAGGGRGTAANATSQLTERLITSSEGTTGQTSNGELQVKLAGTSSSDTGWPLDTAGSTSSSSFWTSGTSFATDVFPERVG
jgi:hypothetical protein